MFTSRVLRCFVMRGLVKKCTRVLPDTVGRSFVAFDIRRATSYPNTTLHIPILQNRMLSNKTSIGQIKPVLSIIFTCNVCQTRQAKTMSKKSYEQGVVLIRCDGCENLHLISDNLGWFRDKKTNVVDILKEKEEEVHTLSDVDMLDLADLDLFKRSSEEDGS